MSDDTKYVILDARQVVGNCALFWRPDGNGYTCDLNEAGLYDKTQEHRDTDIYVPVDVARQASVTHVRVEPLQRAGYWPKPKSPQQQRYTVNVSCEKVRLRLFVGPAKGLCDE